MNEPQESDGRAYAVIYHDRLWIACPFCGKRQFPIDKDAKIRQQYKCKGSNCKRIFKVDME